MIVSGWASLTNVPVRLGQRSDPATGITDSHVKPAPSVNDALRRAVYRRGVR